MTKPIRQRVTIEWKVTIGKQEWGNKTMIMSCDPKKERWPIIGRTIGENIFRSMTRILEIGS